MTLYNGDFSGGRAGWLTNKDVTFALDNTDYGNAAPSAVITHSTSIVGWGGTWRKYPWKANTLYNWAVRLKGQSGLQLYMQANFYNASGVWVSQENFAISCIGVWQDVTGEFIVPDGIVSGDLGIFFKDDTPAAYAASLGLAYRIDDLRITPQKSFKTEFQPDLPAELPFSDAELAFMDESPPGLFPDNQNSNFGYAIRKIFSDRVQDLINQLDTIYSEKFVLTSSQYLDEWEAEVGLPVNTGLFTTDQRRNLILNRLRKGAFTRSARRAVIESFITATFGNSPAFDPSGIPLDSLGIPLYSGISSLSGAYAVREFHPYVNMADQTSFESDIVGLTAGPAGSVAQSSAQAKFGTKSGLFTFTSTVGSYANLATRTGSHFPVTPGKTYIFSAYQRVGSGTRPVGMQLNVYDAAVTTVAQAFWPYNVLPAGQWVRRYIGVYIPPTGNIMQIFPIISDNGVVGDTVFVDGVVVEEGIDLFPYGQGTFAGGLGDWFVHNQGDSNATFNQITSDYPPNVGVSASAEFHQDTSVQYPFVGSPFLPKFDPGADYILSFYAKQPVGTKTYQGSIDQSGGRNTVASTFSFLPTSTWQRIEIPFKAQGAGVEPRFWFWPFTPTGGSSTLRIAKVQLWRVSDYVDPAESVFAYEVRLLNTLGIDMAGLTRELTRLTPAGISFSLVQTPSP